MTPKSFNAPAIKALVTCSPEVNRTSSSLLLNFFDIPFEYSIKLFVVPAIADTTTINLLPLSCSFLTILAACRILLIDPTEVPPNFNTFFAIVKFYYKIIKFKLS